MSTTRNPDERVKHFTTGTVHFANLFGRPICKSALRTSKGWLKPSIEDVTCQRCIEMNGADDVTTNRDPRPSLYADNHAARRAAERAERRRARG